MTAADFPDYDLPQGNANAIASTGVPLLTGINSLGSGTLTLPVNTSEPLLTAPISQIGYDAQISVSSLNGPTYLNVTVNWNDSGAGGALVEQQNYWIVAGPSADPHVVSLSGPSRGDTINVNVFGYNNTITIGFSFAQTSRVYPKHDMRTLGTFFGQGVTVTDGQDVPGQILAYAQHTVPLSGGTYVVWLPLYTGRVTVKLHTASGANDLQATIASTADQLVAQTVFDAETNSQGSATITDVYLPRAQCQLTLTNNNAAGKFCTCLITISE